MRWLMMGYHEEDERPQALETAGHTVDTTPDADSEAWRTAARTQYDGIWIRWIEADHAVRPLVQYRTLRPTTRIVVEIPDDLEPPNAELAQWVQLGIYDIVRPASDAVSVVSHAATIADALRWTGLQPVSVEGGETTKALKTIEFRTVEIEKKVAVSARPVLIVVVGTSPGVGTTTTAVQVARQLTAQGHDVALTESAAAPPALARWESELPKGITVFSSPAPDPLELVRRREWPYVVVDAGAIDSWLDIADWQPDLTILCGPGDRHRFDRWEKLAVGATAYTGSPVVGAVVDGKDGQSVAEGLADEAHLPAFVLPESGKKMRAALQNLLAPVLPDVKPRRRWWSERSHPARHESPDPYRAAPVAPVYAPAAGPSGWGGFLRLFRWAVDLVLLWGTVSLLAWFLVLIFGVPGGPLGTISPRWVGYAQWLVTLDSHILARL